MHRLETLFSVSGSTPIILTPPAVSAEDLKIDSFYNTYLYPDLPPGPISNPGLPSIKAAVYPQESEYWYFLTDRDGKVYYAKDFEDHKKNKGKYLY